MTLPRISICVTTYLSKTYPYLRLCIDSLHNLSYPKDRIEIILCCHQLDYRKYTVEFGAEGVKVITPPEMDYSNARGLNFAVANASRDSEFYWLLNDDVIASKDSLTNLVSCLGDAPAMASPIATCDNYRKFSLVMGVNVNGEFVQLNKQFYRLPELEHMTKEIMNGGSIYPAGVIHTDHLFTFATIIPKCVWDKVGPMEEGFQGAGPDDIDYSIRCNKLGIGMIYVLSSFVLHFGGTSADSSVSVAKRISNARFFKDKHGIFPPGINDEVLENLTEELYKYQEVPGDQK